jgi:uncharacterized protein YcfJ
MNSSKELSMKKAVLVSAMGAMGVLAAGAANAQQEVGRVVSSTPVVQQVPVNRQVCNQQPVAVQQQQPTSGAGAIIGGVVGGLLGHGVGGGMGRAAATGVGVIAGAAVGNSLEQRNGGTVAQAGTQCAVQTTYENRTVGYNVQYEYAGKTYSAQMPNDPGPTIQLRVQPASAAPMMGGAQTLASVDGVQTISAQPVYVQQASSVVYPSYAYPAYAYPAPYYGSYWGAPVGISFGYVYRGGGGHRWHH